MNLNKSHELWNRAKRLIPGGTQLLSKRPEMFLPDRWPAFYSRAKGAEVWDLDGNKFIDMSINGVGACVLGFADPEVNAAVKKAVENGTMCTLNCPEEIELADLLCQLHPWANMAKFARTGGEAIAIAIRIARAYTGKTRIAFCGYHGWHDWYLSANLADDSNLDGHLLPGLEPIGIPPALKNTTIPFHYNQIYELEIIVDKHKDELAAIIMEPMHYDEPKQGFLEEIRKIASRIGAVLIFDEISSGWRMTIGGVHLLYEVDPDMAIFGKAISNGYAMAAIIGKRYIMKAAQTTFISSTYWTENIGPTAALATIRKLQICQVPQYLCQIGNRIKDGWEKAAEKHGLKITVKGMPPMSIFSLDYSEQQALNTLFTQIMLERGFLASKQFFATYAHQNSHIIRYLSAVEEAFKIMSHALKKNEIRKYLKGPEAHEGFKRLT